MEGKLSNLNVARTESRGLAPHKPLILLTVIDLIESGDISALKLDAAGFKASQKKGRDSRFKKVALHRRGSTSKGAKEAPKARPKQRSLGINLSPALWHALSARERYPPSPAIASTPKQPPSSRPPTSISIPSAATTIPATGSP